MTERVTRLRLLLAWLLLAAIPLQGLAAASMLFCGMGPLHGAQAQMRKATIPVAGHDHSSHGHGEAVKVEKAAQANLQLPDSSHKCGVCASCCNGAAITATAFLVPIAPLPQGRTVDPFVPIHPRPSAVPDKPPRA